MFKVVLFFFNLVDQQFFQKTCSKANHNHVVFYIFELFVDFSIVEPWIYLRIHAKNVRASPPPQQ